MASAYMHWAKTRQAAPYNLAVSGVPPVGRRELPVDWDQLEFNGGGGYGWPPLQQALATHLGVDPERVVQAAGTSMANHLAMAACVGPGDEVWIEEPTYGLLVDLARYLGAVVRRFPRPRSMGFQPDLEVLRTGMSIGTRLVVVSDLHNPSSARLPERTLRELVGCVDRVGARLLVDEVYLDAAFDGGARTAHRLGDGVLTTGSLTKVYGLGGLRCGWVVAAPGLAERMRRLDDLFGVVPAHPAERLALAALAHREALLSRSRRVLEANRAVWNRFVAGRSDVEDGMSRMGTVVFPSVPGVDTESLAGLLREQFGTTVVPGHFFGDRGGIRVGLGVPPEEFAEGVRRLGEGLDRFRGAVGR